MARLGMRLMLANGAPVHGSVFRSCVRQCTLDYSMTSYVRGDPSADTCSCFAATAVQCHAALLCSRTPNSMQRAEARNGYL